MATDGTIKYSDLVQPDNSITDLIKQLDELSDTYTNALKNIQREAVQLSNALKSVSGATETGRTATRNAANDADKLAKAQRDLAFAESENAKRLSELRQATKEQNDINKLVVKINNTAEGSYNRLSAQYSLNKIYLNNMTKAERESTAEGRKLVEQTRDIYEEMKRLQEATGKHQLNVGNYTEASDAIAAYGDRLKETLGLNNQFGESILALGRGGEAAENAIAAIGNGFKSLFATIKGLAANPVFLSLAGVAGAGVAFKWWYDYNAGLQEATRLTQQFTGKQGDDLKAFRNEVQVIADTFNADFKETLIATNALSQQFGIDASEAIKIVKDGFIAGGDANGQFLDTLKEYPAYFKEAGINADEFVAIIAQTNKAGIFSDKGVDAIKEANLRLREMTTATADALNGIGISSEQVQKDLQSGAKTTFDVMQEVSQRLNELPASSAAVGTAIADIFGGPGEDAGLQYLKTLKDIDTELNDVKKDSGELGKLQEEQLNSQLELQNALSGLFDATGGNFETLQTRVKVFINEALTGLIKGIISLVNYVIELYNESLSVRVVVNGVIATFKSGLDLIGNAFGFLIDIIKATGTVIKGALTLDFDDVKKGVADYAKAWGNLITTTAKDISDNFGEMSENLQKKIKPLTIPVMLSNTNSKGGAEMSEGGNKVLRGTKNTQSGGGVAKTIEQETKSAEEAYKKNITAIRKLQDAQLAMQEYGFAKQQQKIKYQYSRQVEDLKHTLETQKDLTQTEREAINAQILLLEQQQTDAILKLEKDRQIKELQAQQETIDLKLKAVKKGSLEELNLLTARNRVALEIAKAQNTQKPAGERQSESDITAAYDNEAGGILANYNDAQAAKDEANIKKRTASIQNAISTVTNVINDFSQNTSEAISHLNNILNTQIGGETVFSKLGLTEEQAYAAAMAGGLIIGTLQDIAEARIQTAQAAVEAAEKEVDAAQNALDAELQARANGYASNVAQAQKELEASKKNQQKAIKEQQKAQKQQAAIQSLQQIGNLVTASALIWSQLGFPLAIPAIATMWASFAASKIKAAQLAKNTTNTEEYGEGTVELLEGGSHASGNDIDLGTKKDGTKRRAEGGEFFAVINKRNSRRFRKYIPDVINSLNNGTFAHKYLNAYGGENLPLMVNVSEKPDLRKLSDDVSAIRKSGERKIYTDARGNEIREYKNVRRRIIRR